MLNQLETCKKQSEFSLIKKKKLKKDFSMMRFTSFCKNNRKKFFSKIQITRLIDPSYYTTIYLSAGYFKQFLPTVPTFAVRETDVSRYNGGTSGAPLKPLRDDSALRALSSLRGLRGKPKVPPLCRETPVSRTANVRTVGMNGLSY